jgi:redox-sensitive bicupin YhaK (pirin superfamily)
MNDAQAFEIRRDAARGCFRNDWLDARFSFSFGDWHDPDWPRFGPLRAINEDRVQPGTGFAMHPHRDLEILMLPREGQIEHRDHLGGHAIVAPGELHFMRAGRGIRHSQMNPSAQAIDHHFQIWLAPRTRGLEPAVKTLRLTPPQRGGWVVAASGHGAGGAAIDADADLLWGCAEAGAPLRLPARAGASRYLHLMSGTLAVGGHALAAGDALVQRDAGTPLTLHTDAVAEALCFELPAITP